MWISSSLWGCQWKIIHSSRFVFSSKSLGNTPISSEAGFFFQCRLSVERLFNVLISVLDVMGEEGCSLRNAWRLFYVPWTPPFREALKEEEAKSTARAYRGIHSTLRIQQWRLCAPLHHAGIIWSRAKSVFHQSHPHHLTCYQCSHFRRRWKQWCLT